MALKHLRILIPTNWADLLSVDVVAAIEVVKSPVAVLALVLVFPIANLGTGGILLLLRLDGLHKLGAVRIDNSQHVRKEGEGISQLSDNQVVVKKLA